MLSVKTSKERAFFCPEDQLRKPMPSFNPNEKASKDSGIFGLESTFENASLVLLPVPFEATTSYGTGTVDGPKNILEASKQVDLYHDMFPKAWQRGIFITEESSEVRAWNQKARAWVDADREAEAKAHTQDVNALTEKLNQWVYTETKKNLAAGKIAGLVGGDHATPFGAIRAHLEKFPKMSVLHFDAHFDLRNAYEGYTDSHASIMFNVATKLPTSKLVQVGLRDFCAEEIEFSKSNPRLVAFTDRDLFTRKAKGQNWNSITEEILKTLSDEVYVSFDIDGLDPAYCPHTGTPVPGGLSFQEAVYILRGIVEAGKKIVGFDLVEVGCEEYDGVVGARLLYELSCLSLR